MKVNGHVNGTKFVGGRNYYEFRELIIEEMFELGIEDGENI